MKKFLPVIFLILLLLPMFALAATPCTLDAAKQQTDPSKSLPQCVNQIYVWSLGAGAILALLMMIIGGYYYMTAAGNAEKSSKGTEMIWSSIIGIALLFGAYLLLRTINPDLVEFKLNSISCLDQSAQQNANCQNTTQPTGPR